MVIGETGARFSEGSAMRKSIVIADICILLLLGLTPLLPRQSVGDDITRVGVDQHFGARELGADGLFDPLAEAVRLP